MGEFLELPQVQSFIVFILIIDTFAAMAVLVLNNHTARLNNAAATAATGSGAFPGESSGEGGADVLPSHVFNLLFGLFSLDSLTQALIAFNSFVIVFFSFEVGLVLMVFGSQAVGHWGYLLDATVLSYQVYAEINVWYVCEHVCVHVCCYYHYYP